MAVLLTRREMRTLTGLVADYNRGHSHSTVDQYAPEKLIILLELLCRAIEQKIAEHHYRQRDRLELAKNTIRMMENVMVRMRFIMRYPALGGLEPDSLRMIVDEILGDGDQDERRLSSISAIRHDFRKRDSVGFGNELAGMRDSRLIRIKSAEGDAALSQEDLLALANQKNGLTDEALAIFEIREITLGSILMLVPGDFSENEFAAWPQDRQAVLLAQSGELVVQRLTGLGERLKQAGTAGEKAEIDGQINTWLVHLRTVNAKSTKMVGIDGAYGGQNQFK